MEDDKPRPRIADIAALTGLGTATVDRVLHGRAHVRAATRARVEAAIAELTASGARPAPLLPPPPGMDFRAFLGGRPGFANDLLARALRGQARAAGVRLSCEFVTRRDVRGLVTALEAAVDAGATGLVVQPVAHPLVDDALARLVARGVPVVTVLSAPPGVAGLGYVGLDNHAAGRLAGQIAGLICGGRGAVACLTSSAYHSHVARESGLRAVLREQFPGLDLVAAIATEDDPTLCHRETAALLARHPDLAGLVNFAAGNRGVERALIDAGRAGQTRFVTFNLTPLARMGLVSNRISAVIHQDLTRIARDCVAMLIAAHRGTPPGPAPIPAELILREGLHEVDDALM